MKIGIIIAVVIYEILSILLVGLYVSRKNKQNPSDGNSFALGGRSLGTWAVGTTICMICLGSGHTTGTMEGAVGMGLSQVWHTMGNGIALSLGAVTTFVWARRLRITSIGEIMTTLYSEGISVMIAAVNIAVGWTVCSCETQAVGIVLNAITGWDLETAVLVGAIIGFLYVIIGGMSQSAILNEINVIILYVGFALALVLVVMGLGDGGLQAVADSYVSSGKADMIKFTGKDGFLLKAGIPTLLAPFFCNICGQQTMQTAASAKSESAVRNIAFFVGPMNCLIGGVSATLAVIALSLPQYAGLDAKVITMHMLVDMLPSWLIVILLAAFLAALLSSYGGFLMGPATMITVDFVKDMFKPNMSSKEETRWIRIFLCIGAVVCGAMAQALPPIIEMMTWLFSFMIPIFFLLIFGLWWKRNKSVAIWTFLASFIFANIWTFTPLKYSLGLQDLNMAYVMIAISIFMPLIGTSIFGGEIGYFKSQEWKESEAYRIYLKELKKEKQMKKA